MVSCRIFSSARAAYNRDACNSRTGLVVNTAKYLDGQPLVAFNPDPARMDGVLIPFPVNSAADVLSLVLEGHYRVPPGNDGQGVVERWAVRFMP